MKRVARERLGLLPTPLHELPRLAAALRGPRLFVKRDDLIGFALGGNKVRKLEYFLADALAKGADALLTTGGVQSNHARVTAAAAARAGMRAILILSGRRPERLVGNARLDALVGAELHFVADRLERQPRMLALADQLAREGRRPYCIPLGGSVPLGAYAYVEAARELATQVGAIGISPAAIVVSSSSGGTQAGLVVGAKAAGLAAEVIGISPDEPREALARMVGTIATGLGELVEAPRLGGPAEITVLDDQVGDGYGIPTPASEEALALFAKTEGIFLDPTYGAKAAAGLIDLVRRDRWRRDEVVLFWQTGALINP
jgi:D-cysteine desulfhydrase family pyridoxal phosphate-dependent enzyme